MLRAAKFRIYPTAAQETFLWAQWGAVRKCWNMALFLKKHYYRTRGVSLNLIHEIKPLIARAKKSKKYAWLREYDSMALQESVRNLNKSYRAFFEGRAGFPHYKSRRGPQSSYHCTNVSVGPNYVRVPKMEPIKARIHREIVGKVKSITLEADSAGDYYAAVLWEDGLAEKEPLKEIYEDQVIGIDVGIKDLLTVSNGRKEPNPRHLKRARKALRRRSRQFSRTKKGSRRREKARRRLARAHKRVANARNDNLHKVSSRLVNESQALAAEGLRIINMLKNHCLAESIADAAWSELFRMIAYKAKREGKYFVQIDTFFPSSKTCSCCGFKLEKLDLATREWTCPHCGSHHDRDVNAAANIRAEGIRKLRAEGLPVLRRETSSPNAR